MLSHSVTRSQKDVFFLFHCIDSMVPPAALATWKPLACACGWFYRCETCSRKVVRRNFVARFRYHEDGLDKANLFRIRHLTHGIVNVNCQFAYNLVKTTL